ncbi:myosin-binding protein 7-like [Prosopis cineraria]|uniref:myosin-binding protein 7-like n=1 Tax=Prosopis cineraria TaxID=364024 RepID=UPI00240EB1C4|nr:myosin-binding protein 7-like [Prosopis cineraria]XP_054800311.1 myosin-binding protein 7-like [Prosopis cineraria]
MESDAAPFSSQLVKCCDGGCRCSLVAESPGTWIRSVKRKHDEFERGNQLFLPALNYFSVARVQIENECAALREIVSRQQETIQDLYAELEEERNASSTAANEAMSMILRLQREKAEIQMEARQFKSFVEEKMLHDREEVLAFEDLLYKREQAIESLTCEVQAYKHRMMSYGLTESEADGRSLYMEDIDAEYEPSIHEYPPLKCNVNETHNAARDADDVDVEKYAFGETPRDRLRNLENRICQMERNPTYSQVDGDISGKNILEKVIVGQSPRPSKHSRKFSGDSSTYAGMGREMRPESFVDSPKLSSSFRKIDHIALPEDLSNLKRVDNASEAGDDTGDRVYTIDSIHSGPQNGIKESKPVSGVYEDYSTTPRVDNVFGYEDPDIKKLSMRLQALEADRESMKQTIISMSTDKAQIVLLREIAQHLCKEMSPQRRMAVKRPSVGGFSSIIKTITAALSWRKKARQSKYTFGQSANGVGLQTLLDNGPRARQWRCLSSTELRV